MIKRTNCLTSGRAWFYFSLCLYLTVLTAGRLREKQQSLADWNSYLREMIRLVNLDANAGKKVEQFIATFKANSKRMPSLSEAQEALNGGRPFSSIDREPSDRVRFVDAADGHAMIYHQPNGIVTGVVSEPRRAVVPDPPVAFLVFCFASAIVAHLALLARYIRHLKAWKRQSRVERIAFAWTTVGWALTASYLGWLGSKFFPSWEPTNDQSLLGKAAILSSFSLAFLVNAYLSARPADATARCGKCRYDLTGNLSGICPECGTAVTAGSISHSTTR